MFGIRKCYVSRSTSGCVACFAYSALVFGVVCILITYLVSLLGNLLQAALSLFGVLSGPISAIFMIGFFLPWINSAVMLSSSSFWCNNTCLGCIGWFNRQCPGANLDLFRCPSASESNAILPFTHSCWRMQCIAWEFQRSLAEHHDDIPDMEWNRSSSDEYRSNPGEVGWWMSPSWASADLWLSTFRKSPLLPFYGMSYFWYTMFSIFTALIVSVVVSYFTGEFRQSFCLEQSGDIRLIAGFRKPEDVDPAFIIPVFDILCPFLPEKIRAKLRFGVRHRRDSDQVIG